MTALRTCHPPMGELYDIRQTRVRELEKKLALETVRCEELQLELTSLQKNRINQQQQQQQQQFQHQSSLPYGMTTTGIGVGMNIGTSYNSGMGVGSAVDWGSSNKHCDIDKIVAKIEQDNRMLADLEHNRPSAGKVTLNQKPANGGYVDFLENCICGDKDISDLVKFSSQLVFLDF